MYLMTEIEAMHRAIAHARSVEGRTSPRPPVGAVVVRDGEIVGAGATMPPYGPHAEVQALEQAGIAAQGADLYVTLEPCCIHIHTPPCTDAVMRSGIHRVIVGALDPNPRVSGRGIERLRSSGIEVVLLEDCREAVLCKDLLRPFETYIMTGRPYVTAKWAMTLDGKLATSSGDSYWISGPDARTWVHDLRDRVDAIMIGANTARHDDPLLTIRLAPEEREWSRTPRIKQPLRLILATNGNLLSSLQLLQAGESNPTCILVGETCSQEQQALLKRSGADVLPVALDASGHIDFLAALRLLADRGIMHVLLEGGATLLSDAFDRQCVDAVATFIAPKLVGGSSTAASIMGSGKEKMAQATVLCNEQIRQFEHDVLIEGEVVY